MENNNNILSGKDWGNDSPKTYVVLGCHRSGTSFIANALLKMGVDMGSTPWRCEDIEFVKLNEKIINGDWRSPASHESIMQSAKEYVGEIKRLLLSKRKKNYLFGWKDPRQVLTAEAYLPYFDGDTYLICMFRKPEYVKESLARMGQYAKGDIMAKEYSIRIIHTIMKFMGIELNELL